MTAVPSEVLNRIACLERRVAHLESLVGVEDKEEIRSISSLLAQACMILEDIADFQRIGGQKPPEDRYLKYLKIFRFSRGDGLVHSQTNISEPGDFHKLLSIDEETVAIAASCLANSTRVRIVKSLLKGNKTAAELTAATGFSGGQLYHHLNHLTSAEFVSADPRGVYSLTQLGLDLTVTFLFDVGVRRAAAEDMRDAAEPGAEPGDTARQEKAGQHGKADQPDKTSKETDKK